MLGIPYIFLIAEHQQHVVPNPSSKADGFPLTIKPLAGRKVVLIACLPEVLLHYLRKK